MQIAKHLEGQADDKSSALLKGVLTRHTQVCVLQCALQCVLQCVLQCALRQ